MMSRLNVDGLDDLTAAENKHWKIAWTAILVATGIMLIVQIGLTINTFVTSPLSSTWSIEPLKDKNFPVLYICPVYVSESTWFLSPHVFVEIDEYLNSIFSNHEFGFNPSSLTFDGIKNMSDVVQTCYFERKPINCSDVVNHVFDPKYGTCIVVDVKKPQRKIGFGLTLALNIGKKSPAIIRGAVLSIMDNRSPIGGLTNVLLQVGQWSKIVIEAQRLNMLNLDSWTTKQPCYDASDAGPPKYKSLNYSTYSWDLCRLDCTQTMINKYCNFTVPLEILQNQTPGTHNTCNEGYLSYCVFKTINEHSVELEECKEKCLMPCTTWQYHLTMSSVKFHGNQELADDTVMDKLCDVKLGKGELCLPRTIVLDIGYDNLLYTDVSQNIPITWDTFIGNIGGQVGLWMGISVVSIFQLLILGITVFFYRSKKTTAPKTRKYKFNSF